MEFTKLLAKCPPLFTILLAVILQGVTVEHDLGGGRLEEQEVEEGGTQGEPQGIKG